MAHRDDPRDRYERECDRIQFVTKGAPTVTEDPGRLRGDITQAGADAILDLLQALDPEHSGKIFQANGNGTETKKPKTLSNYAVRLRLPATAAEGDLLEQDTESINQLMAGIAKGSAPVAPADGYSKGTVGQDQSTLKAFHRYHDGHGVDPYENSGGEPKKDCCLPSLVIRRI